METYRVYVEHLFRRSDNADTRIFAKDARKIILNANAFQQADNQDLRGFLRYVVTGEISTEYTRRIDDMVRTIKVSEQIRKEYRILPAVIMDAIDEGARQAKLETAKKLLQFGLAREKIAQATGLTCEEVELL